MAASLRQLLLIAFQSTADGEALTALRMATKLAKEQGLDAHKLADSLNGQAARPAQSGFGEAMLRSALAASQAQCNNAIRQVQQLSETCQKLTREVERLKREAAARHYTAAAPAAPEGPLPYQRRPADGPYDWRARAQALLDNHEQDLPRREVDFLQSIIARNWPNLTPRQQEWLDDIWTKMEG